MRDQQNFFINYVTAMWKLWSTIWKKQTIQWILMVRVL